MTLYNVINAHLFVRHARLFGQHSLFGTVIVQVKMAASTSKADTSTRVNISNGLLLYYHQYSFYSQKVVMALYEKNLPFESHIVNIAKGEQYQNWFLKLNPRGEVPVLQDDGKIIPDSTRIIDYLEDNFSNGDTPRLIPMTKGSNVRQRITHFRHLFDQIPAGVVTMGSLFHPELVENRKMPFIAPVRHALINAEKNSSTNLRIYADKNPEAKEILIQKASFQDKKHETILNLDEFKKILDQVDFALEEVEKELSSHTGDKADWWLCCDNFTVADIGLTILLERLSRLGLDHRFWSNGKRINVSYYYERVKQRSSYKKTIPSAMTHIKLLFGGKAPIIIGAGVIATIAFLVGGVLIIKKYVS